MFSRVLVACAAALPAAVLSISVTWAAEPTAFFDKSSIVGQGETISVSRVPVRNSAGAIKYYDATIEFSVDAAGKLTQTALPTFTLSPSLIISNFKAGTYTTTAGSSPIAVKGPGVGGPGGQTAWTVQATTSSCTNPPSATWYTGSIATNPLKARLQQAGITQTQYSYGIVGKGPACSDEFGDGALIGAQQVGNTFTLVSFTTNGPTDHPVPVSQITFTLKP